MKKLREYVLLIFLVVASALGIAYLLAPDFVKNTAVDLLYPTVTIEEKYTDEFSIEVPRVFEFMYITCSLTETFQNDPNLINSRTPGSYEEVKKDFKAKRI